MPVDIITLKLHFAISGQKDARTIANILDQGADIHAKAEDGDNSLHVAALTNPHTEVCLLLLEKGANVEETGESGRTALHKAAECNTKEVVQALLDKGANIQAKDKFDYTPLHISAHFNSRPEVTLLLLERGADIKAMGNQARTALHAAAGHNTKEVVNVLLKNGADLEAKDDSGYTPLHFSAQLNPRPEVSAFLIEKGADIKATGNYGATPLHLAACNKGENTSEIVEMLVKAEPKCLWQTNDAGKLPVDMAIMHQVGNRALLFVEEIEHWMDVYKAVSGGSEKSVIQVQGIKSDRSKPETVKNGQGQESRPAGKAKSSKQTNGNKTSGYSNFKYAKSHHEATEAIRSKSKAKLQQLLKNGSLHKMLEDEQMELFYKALVFIKKAKGSLLDGLSSKWQAMTVMEMACELGNTDVIQELYHVDPGLLKNSNALTIATDPAVLLLITSLAPGLISNSNANNQYLAHLMAMSFGDEDQLVKNARILIRSRDKISEDKQGITPIVLAIQNNKLKLLEYFLELNPGLARTGSPSPIWFCTATSNVKAAKKLLPQIKKEDLLAPGPDTSSPYIIARVKNDKDMIKLLQGNLPEANIKDMDKLFSQPARPVLSALSSKIQLKTHRIPVFNDRACPAWEGKEGRKLQVIDAEIAIKKHVLEVCGIQHSSSNFISDLVRELEDCTGEHSNPESNLTCHLVTDLLKLVSRLEIELKEHPMLQYMRPSFYLIGSLAECTRLGMGNELDITVSFEAVKGTFFTLGQTSFDVVLTEAGVSFFSKSDLKHLIFEDNKFNSSAFVMDVLDACVACVERVRLPHRLSIAMKNSMYKGAECSNCQKATKEMYGATQFPPQCHCMNCLPAVTMTKLGPCLLFQWRKDKSSEPINCSIDLIPVLPHSASTAELFQQAVQTLLNERPEGWEQTMKSYFERDRIIVNSHQTGECSFALKIQNFGPNPNFMIRAGQTFDKELFEGPHLKDVYICIKGLKTLLGISSLKSYFVKKVILKPEVQVYAKRSPSKLQLFYQAISQPELRPFFEDKINYFKLREDIRERKTEIVVHRLKNEAWLQ